MRNRQVGINIRVTETEKRKLTLDARSCKLTLPEYLRRLGFGYEFQVIPQKNRIGFIRPSPTLKVMQTIFPRRRFVRNCRVGCGLSLRT